MGYRVEWHIPKGKFDFDVLDTLPSGLQANVFQVDGCDFDLIYVDFHSRKVFPQRFDGRYDRLNRLYESLIDANLEVALNPQVVNLNLWLSNTLQDEVISIDADDDQRDLAVQSQAGALGRVRFRAEDVEVVYENDEVHIYPLVTELDGPLVDLEVFHGRGFTAHARDKEQTSELHEIAAEEIHSFLGIEPQVIGLATWDFDEERLQTVFAGKQREKQVTESRTASVAPKESKQLSLKARIALVMSLVIVVSALNGYREYERAGSLESSWYLMVGATIVLVLVAFVVLAKKK